MLFKTEPRGEYTIPLVEGDIQTGDVLLFGKEYLEIVGKGARIIDVSPLEVLVHSMGYCEHRNKNEYLLKPIPSGTPCVLYESTILRYGAFRKERQEPDENDKGKKNRG